MIKLCLLLFSLTLFARENPFFPINSALDIPLTTEQMQKPPMLKRATLTLPSSAREIESVVVRYKNMDGSISEKSVTLQNSVDWHLPIFISQNYNLNGSSQRKMKYIKFVALPFISFSTKDKEMQIDTKDRLLRSFLLVKPHRIVCDFKRDIDLRSFVKKAKQTNVFKKINIGTHRGYYRVVIELDGFYKYSIKKTNKGYLISLK